jgi:hypothetical protein
MHAGRQLRGSSLSISAHLSSCASRLWERKELKHEVHACRHGSHACMLIKSLPCDRRLASPWVALHHDEHGEEATLLTLACKQALAKADLRAVYPIRLSGARSAFGRACFEPIACSCEDLSPPGREFSKEQPTLSHPLPP